MEALGLGQGQNGKLKFVGKRKCDSSSGKLATNVIRPRVVVGGCERSRRTRAGQDKYFVWGQNIRENIKASKKTDKDDDLHSQQPEQSRRGP